MPITPRSRGTALPALRCDETRRVLRTEDGSAVFLVADAAPDLLGELARSEVESYLAARSARGFNSVQVTLALDGMPVAGADSFGEASCQWRGGDARSEPLLDRLDWLLERAAFHGLYLVVGLEGGDIGGQPGGDEEVSATVIAFRGGEALGRRFGRRGIVWALDRSTPVGRAVGEGLLQGDAGGACIERWKNETRAGLTRRFGPRNAPTAQRIALSRSNRTGLSLLPVWENAPFQGTEATGRRTNAADVRAAFYGAFFAGELGCVYGHPAVAAFQERFASPSGKPRPSWRESMLEPGAAQVGMGRRLLESRPLGSRERADEILQTDPLVQPIPGAMAVRNANRSCAMVYVPEGRAARVRLDSFEATLVRAWRFDPRSGRLVSVGMLPANGEQTFAPPVRGEWLDWILVLDDASRGWSAPGA